MKFDKKRLGAVLLGLLILTGGAVAYTTVFTAGSGTSYETGSGLVVSTSVDHGLDSSNPFLDTETVYIDGVSISASGPASVTVDQFRGSRTTVSGIDASSNTITVDPDDKSRATISGGVTALSWEDAALDGSAQLAYSASGTGTITLSGLAANTNYAAATTSGNVLTTGETTGDGEATINVDAATDKNIVLLEPSAPVLDNLNATPRDGTKKETRTVALSVPLNDTDFAKTSGDELQVDFYFDGSVRSSKTVTANGTVSADITVDTGGEHDWRVEVTDNYGNTVISDADESTSTNETFSFLTPSELRVYNESSPTALVNNSAVELRFYFEGVGDDPDLIETRSTTNGTIDMAGLPTGESFVVVADTAGYAPRRIFVPDLYEQQEVYLLPDSSERVDTIFEIEDYSGDFPADQTVLLVQRELAEQTWTTVLGDFFGANSDFPATLAKNVRHRLVLLNTGTGQRRVLGTYTPLASETETVTVAPDGEFAVVGRGPTVSVSPELAQLPPRDGINVEAGVVGDDELQAWTATIVAVNTTTGSETTLATRSNASAGTLPLQADLSGRDGERLKVRVEWTTASDSGSRTIGYRIEQSPAAGGSLLDALGAFSLLLPADDRAGVLAFVAMSTTVVGTAAVASVHQIPTEIAGLIALLFLLAFAIVGWTGYDLVFLAGVALAALAFLRRRY